VLAWILPLLALFGPVLLLDRSFAFRDAAHYYAPFYRYVQGQWSQGLPLWNPLEENGRPLLADPTASVLYPGKLVFTLPCAFAWSYRCYVVGHIVLAACGSFLAARSIGCGAAASGFAGLAYAFGGSVCFQYCNVIYLVGAAWLPLGVMALMQLMGDQPARGVVTLSFVLAMIVLGGDPQTAYVIVLAGLVFLLLGAISGGERRPQGERQPSHPRAFWLALRCSRLLLACSVALGLAAVQVWPSWSWARVSQRTITTDDTSQSLPDWIRRGAPMRRGEWSGLFQTPEPGSHRDVLYRFSVGPWRWPELIWPNFGGRPFPVHQRWISAIPAEGGFWTPSLYMGLWPALLGLTGLTLRRRDHLCRQWLSWLAVAAIVACLGRYGLGWAWDELRYAVGARHPSCWSPIGGLYWLLTVILPGFILFRYPAKLWCLAALGLCLLAAGNLDRLTQEALQRWQRRMQLGSILLSPTLLVGWVSGGALTSRIQVNSSDALFGPLNWAAAWHALLQGGLHLLLVLVVSIIVLRVCRMKPGAAAIGILLVTSVELAFAQSWMVRSVRQPLPGSPPPAVAWMKATTGPAGDATSPRFLREQVRGWYPASWATTSSSGRLAACVRWDRLTLRPKYHLDYSCRAAASVTSFSSADYRALLSLLDRSRRSDPALYSALLDAMGIRHIIAPAQEAARHQASGRKVRPGPTRPEDYCLVENPSAFSRAWVVYQAERIPPLGDTTWPDLNRRTEQVFLEDGQPRDLSRIVILESHAPAPEEMGAAVLSRNDPEGAFQEKLSTQYRSAQDSPKAPTFAKKGEPPFLSCRVGPASHTACFVEVAAEPAAPQNTASSVDDEHRRRSSSNARSAPWMPLSGGTAARHVLSSPRNVCLASVPPYKNRAAQDWEAPRFQHPSRIALLPTSLSGESSERGMLSQERPAECTITMDRPSRVEIEATLARSGYLVLNDAFADGWTCESRSGSGGPTRLPVMRANRVMRCVALPAGRHHVVFRYRPKSVAWGGLTSGFCWLGLAGCVLWRRRRRRRRATR
jgi:hypothetical protein